MDLKFTFEGRFTRSQIAGITAAHPELGKELAAQAYLSGAAPITNSTKGRTVRAEKTIIPDDALYRISKRMVPPAEGTNFRQGLDELIKQFKDEPFFYLNVKEVAKKFGFDVALAANLRNRGYIVPVKARK